MHCSGDANASNITAAAHGPSACDGKRLFGDLAGFALLTPLMLWACPSLLREPSADVRGDAVLPATDGRLSTAVELCTVTAVEGESSAEEIDALVADHGGVHRGTGARTPEQQ